MMEAVRLVMEESLPLATAAVRCGVPKATLYSKIHKGGASCNSSVENSDCTARSDGNTTGMTTTNAVVKPSGKRKRTCDGASTSANKNKKRTSSSQDSIIDLGYSTDGEDQSEYFRFNFF